MAKNKGFKKANKSATKGKGRLWRKGQSSNFNPQFNKHRLQAKKKTIFSNQGLGNLTEEKLAQHNRIISTGHDEANDESMSIGGDTAVTAFTNCSIPTFNRLLKNWNVSSFLHKEMLAVLAAVTDVLKTSGGKETETEYFAALMTTLDVVETDEALTAVICLLSMVVKRLKPSVLQLHSETTCEVFIKLLIKYMNTEHCALLRNLLTILYTFLKVKTVWKESSEEFSVLLEYTTHSKPRVRKSAQQIVRTLLVDHQPESSSHHPVAVDVAKFCVQKLENSGSNASNTTFHVLSLLKEVIGVFPKASVKLCCETILRVMTLSNAMITCNCLKVYQGLFSSSPKLENLPVDLNARIIMALYDYQPNINDSRALIDWLDSMNLAFVNLYRLDANLCLSHLPKFYEIAVKCWLSDRDEVLSTVSSVLKNLLQTCVHPENSEFQQALMDDPVNNCMHRMFHFVENTLSYQFHKAWNHVLGVLATFFEVMGKHCYTVMLTCLQSLADMHDSYQFPHIAELEKAIGIAVHHMGPSIVLKAIPLTLSENSDKPDFPRSWLLPLLRDHIKQTELSYFVKYFLPLAGKLRNKFLSLEQDGKIVESKLFDVICSQVWSLLPGFCTEPTDLKQCFKDVARTLGVILRDEPTLRMTILSALRVLISKNIGNDENTAEIARFSKNFLPILFNLYTTPTKNKAEERVRLAVYETCKVYLQITDKELCHNFFNKAMDRLIAPDVDPFLQQAMIDLNKAMLPLVDEEFISTFYDYCKPLLNNANHTTQKKCYGAISVLCTSASATCQSFVHGHLDDLRSMLCGSKTGLTASSRALRLNCLRHIVHQLTESSGKEYVSAILPEAVLCTKEATLKTRTAAYNLLVEIGNTFIRWNADDDKGGIQEFMMLLLPGLAGSPHLMSSTILAIGRIIFEFKGSLDSKVIQVMVENICLLLQSSSREIVVSALSFVKVLFATLDTMELAQHVEFMVKSITSLSNDNQKHFRFKAREIFTKLIRKFGYEMILKMVPAQFEKQLSHIRKTEARRKRDKEKKIESEDELFEPKKISNNMEDILQDSDEEIVLDEDLEKSQRGGKKKKRKGADPWIEEKDEDNIADFMDPSINKKILSSKPQNPAEMKVKKTTSSFPVSEDGRLIIKDEEEDEEETTAKSKHDKRAEVLNELGAAAKKTKKRKFDDSEDDDDATQSKGVKKGIHRTVGKTFVKKMKPGEQFKAKKAGGDIKKGNVDPYAYLPLNRQALNKRKHVKVKGQFNNIIKGAKKGAMAGAKRKGQRKNQGKIKRK